MTEAEFRAAFPEFANVTTYPSVSVAALLATATVRLSPELWQDTLDQGLGLFVAHYLAFNAKQTASLGAPVAVMTAKSVDSVSASYDPKYTTFDNGGFWNMTSYGQQFLYLARMVGKCAPSQFYGA